MADLPELAPQQTQAPPLAAPRVDGPCRTCNGCTQPLARRVVFTHADGRTVCMRCRNDTAVVDRSAREDFSSTDAPYLRICLLVPGEDQPRVLEVTATQAVIVGRKLLKFKKMLPALLENSPEVEFSFVAVDHESVAGVHVGFEYSVSRQAFYVTNYARGERSTYGDLVVAATTKTLTAGPQGLLSLTEQQRYYLLHPGTRLFLRNPDQGAGPMIVVDDLCGCRCLEGYRMLMDVSEVANDVDERHTHGRLLDKWRPRKGDIDLRLAVAGTDGAGDIILTPDRVVVVVGVPPGDGPAASLARCQASDALAEQVAGTLGDPAMGDPRDRWTHAFCVPIDDMAFHRPLFLVCYQAGDDPYVAFPLCDRLESWTKGGGDHKVAFETVLCLRPFARVGAGPVRMTVEAHKRIPTKVFPPRVAMRTADSITLEWPPADSRAPVKRYEIWQVGSGETAGRSVMMYRCEGLVRSLRIGDLEPNTPYHLFLKAVTYDGGAKSAVARVATSSRTIPSATATGLVVATDKVLSTPSEGSPFSPEAATTYAATYGDTPMAVTEYVGLDPYSESAHHAREMIEVLQGLCDHPNLARFFGGTEYRPPGSGRLAVNFQLRTEAPLPSVARIWPAYGAPNVVPHVCREVAAGLHFLHEAGVIHRNINLETVVVRVTPDALEANPASILKATFAVTGFEHAVMERGLRRKLSKPPRGSVNRVGGEVPSGAADVLAALSLSGGGTGSGVEINVRRDSDTSSSSSDGAPVNGGADGGADNDAGTPPASPARRGRDPHALDRPGDRNFLPQEALSPPGDRLYPALTPSVDSYALGSMCLSLVLWKQRGEEPVDQPAPLLHHLIHGALSADNQRLCRGCVEGVVHRGSDVILDRLQLGGESADILRGFLGHCFQGPDAREPPSSLMSTPEWRAWVELAGGDVDVGCSHEPMSPSEDSSECSACGGGEPGSL